MRVLSRPAWIVLWAASLTACAVAPPFDAVDRETAAVPVGVDVLHQTVEIAPFAAKDAMTGAQTVTFRSAESGDRLRFKGGAIQFVSIQIDGRPVADWTLTDGTLDIVLAKPISRGVDHTLSVAYTAPRGRGVRLSDDLAYTTYFACDWMLCDQENFDDRFTFDLSIRTPRGMASLGPGREVEIVPAGADQELHLWRTSQPFPAYVHGFVVGRLDRFDLSGECSSRLEVLSTAPRDRVNAIFQPTCAMLTYFEGRAGVPYPSERYGQFYDPDRWEAQEAISHSTLGGGAVEVMLTDPREDWAVAHELAHQWWGNRVTAQNLAEFWLNEGVVTFMVAGWKEHRWGREAYQREIALARGRWSRCRQQWRDVPLAFAGDYPSVATRRCFQYSKAAVFLDELRTTMGEAPFWNGLRSYTRANLGQSVTSRDFQAAMQHETPTDLGPLFDEWVHPTGADGSR